MTSFKKLIHKQNVKDTHRKKAPSNKTPALTKSRNLGIWVAGASNQVFIPSVSPTLLNLNHDQLSKK